ncbi:MAG: hypothetical protein AB7F75_10460, partial [Planctomycetota bacterium]
MSDEQDLVEHSLLQDIVTTDRPIQTLLEDEKRCNHPLIKAWIELNRFRHGNPSLMPRQKLSQFEWLLTSLREPSLKLLALFTWHEVSEIQHNLVEYRRHIDLLNSFLHED